MPIDSDFGQIYSSPWRSVGQLNQFEAGLTLELSRTLHLAVNTMTDGSDVFTIPLNWPPRDPPATAAGASFSAAAAACRCLLSIFLLISAATVFVTLLMD